MLLAIIIGELVESTKDGIAWLDKVDTEATSGADTEIVTLPEVVNLHALLNRL